MSDGFLLDCLELADLAGLERELAWLVWVWTELLYPDPLDDVDSDGEWYGFPTPNSWAKLIAGTAGAPSWPALLPVRGWMRLVRGGGALVVSTLLGRRVRSLAM